MTSLKGVGGGQFNGDDTGGKGKGKDDNIPHVY